MTLRRLGALTFYVVLTACSVESPTAPPPEQTATQNDFSDEDRRLARALSISNRIDLVDKASPYMQAITCELALETLVTRMTDMDILTSAQMAALRRVQQDISRTIPQIASREGKSEADIGFDKAQQREAVSDPVVRLQTGMACLRKQLGASDVI